MRFAVIPVVLGLVSAACGGRTPYGMSNRDGGGPGPDTGTTTCSPPCADPYVCQQGQCVCPPQTCCLMVDCWCDPEQRFCEGDTLSRCEWREVLYEDGMCGSVCDYPPIRECASGCVEEGWGEAYCEDEPEGCGEQPAESYDFTVTDGLGQVFDCNALRPDAPELTLEFGGRISDQTQTAFTVMSQQGEQHTVTHNLPWTVSNCLWEGRRVQVQVQWEFFAWQSCIQTLVVNSQGLPTLIARDGSASTPENVPITVSLHDLECPFDPGPWCVDPATYALDFDLAGIETVRVFQGETTEADLMGFFYEIHNARSYTSGLCDDGDDFAYYITEVCGDG